VKDQVLPQPVIPSGKLKGRRYWYLTDIVEFQQRWKTRTEGELQTASE
jgi:hypothetical protein